jgi:hypothetical protein
MATIIVAGSHFMVQAFSLASSFFVPAPLIPLHFPRAQQGRGACASRPLRE